MSCLVIQLGKRASRGAKRGKCAAHARIEQLEKRIEDLQARNESLEAGNELLEAYCCRSRDMSSSRDEGVAAGNDMPSSSERVATDNDTSSSKDKGFASFFSMARRRVANACMCLGGRKRNAKEACLTQEDD